ncbi:basic leucine zipper 2-like isoform X2 [Wolffia australiana]
MAQLPPKVPNISPNWPNFTHQRAPSAGNLFPGTATSSSSSHQSWVDEFLDFSAVKRGAHRRSASDSIAFLELPMMVNGEDCHRNGSAARDGRLQEFDRLDDDQLMSMFSDDVPPAPASSSNTSSPSDEKAGFASTAVEPQSQEANSDCKSEPGEAPETTTAPPQGAAVETIVDPKRVKRILANRQSAQRSRVRKLQYISELERSVTSLQTEVSALSPRVAFLDHQRSVLTMGNSALKQRIAALAQDKIFKDGQFRIIAFAFLSTTHQGR